MIEDWERIIEELRETLGTHRANLASRVYTATEELTFMTD